jgi:hypothetical protein
MPLVLAAGCGRVLRLFDMRRSAAVANVPTGQRPLSSLSFDPLVPERMATTSEDGARSRSRSRSHAARVPHPERRGRRADTVVKLWDSRMLSDPLMTVSLGNRQIQSVAWCPTRDGALATAHRDDPTLKLWDLRCAAHGSAWTTLTSHAMQRSLREPGGDEGRSRRSASGHVARQ